MASLTPGCIRTDKKIVRREFLGLCAVATAAALSPATALAALGRLTDPGKNLSFYNLHTDEYLDVCYCQNGRYDPAALKKINHILRDHRSGEVKAIDTQLLDLLHTLSLQTRSSSPFHVISGYRSPTTNSMLRQKSKGIASKSLHMYGKAIDIRLPGFATRHLRDVARAVRGGGVGFYPKADFVHVDVGRVRFW